MRLTWKLKFDCNSIESHTAIEGSHEIAVRMRTSVFEARNVIAYSIWVQLQQVLDNTWVG